MDDKKRVFTVLAIDGGGVRGVMPARVLQEIEERTGKPIVELFDLVGGVSTGAILAAGLAVPDAEDPKKPKFTAEELKQFYLRYCSKIFPEKTFKTVRNFTSGPTYDGKALDEIFDKNFGDVRIRDSLTHLMIPVTDIKTLRSAWIKSIKGQKDDSREGWESMYLKDALRAATTAPTYFPAKYYDTTPNENVPEVTHRHALIDGGFFCGNLLQRLHTQAKKLAPPDAEIVIVHIGTGKQDLHLSPEEWNKLSPVDMVKSSKGSILVSMALNVPTIDAEENIRDEIGDRFISFDGIIDPLRDPKSPANAVDDSSAENLKKLEERGAQVVRDSEADMVRLCQILKTRTLTENQYDHSQKALRKLSEILSEKRTVKHLIHTYEKIVQYTTDINNQHAPGDEEIYQLSKKLREHHKVELDRYYHVLLDKKQHESSILNGLKQIGEDFKKAVAGDDPSKEARNDNEPPPTGNNSKDTPPPPPPAPPAIGGGTR